jgi:hypothetical protein
MLQKDGSSTQVPALCELPVMHDGSLVVPIKEPIKDFEILVLELVSTFIHQLSFYLSIFQNCILMLD